MNNETLKIFDSIISNSTSAFIEALGMHWENVERQQNGMTPAYDGKAFFDLIKDHEIDYSSIKNRTIR